VAGVRGANGQPLYRPPNKAFSGQRCATSSGESRGSDNQSAAARGHDGSRAGYRRPLNITLAPMKTTMTAITRSTSLVTVMATLPPALSVIRSSGLWHDPQRSKADEAVERRFSTFLSEP
jgi:hypothetical protein